MRSWRRGTILAALIALAVAGAGLWWFGFRDAQPGNGTLMLTGNVDVRQVNLAFEVPGRIASLEVEEGDSVHGGQILARIDTADLEDHVRLARASVDASEAVLDELEAGARPEEIDQARAAVAQAEAELRFAEATLSRLQELAERDVASHQLHDEAQARKDEAEAQLEGARQVLALLESGPRSETITQAAAKLTADRVTLSLAERSLGNAALSAPNDGVVLSRIREPGSIVGAGEPVYALALTSPVWVRSYIDEPDLGAVRPGMAVEVSTDSGHVYSGQIGFISPVAEFTPKTVQTRELRTSLVYRLRVIVDNPDQGLRQGMPVTVVLMLDEADEDAS